MTDQRTEDLQEEEANTDIVKQQGRVEMEQHVQEEMVSVGITKKRGWSGLVAGEWY